MPRYRYEAKDDAGKVLHGVLTTTSAATATTQLEAQGLCVRSVSFDNRQLGEAEAPMAAAVDRLIASHAALVEPLTAYAEEFASGHRRRELQANAALLRENDREKLLTAAGDDPTAWSALLAAVAEQDPSQSLFARFAERETNVTEVRRKRSLALAYPLFIAMLCLAVVWALSLIVMPTFNAIFRDFGLELPGLTSLVLAIGCFLSSGGAVFIFGLLLLAVALWMIYPLWAPQRVRHFLSRLSSLRRANRSLARARLATHLANLTEAGLSIPAGVALLNTTGVNDTSADHQPPTGAITYAADGELSTGTRTQLLRTFATNFNEASAEVEAWTMGMAGPLTIVTLGLIVGFTTIALFLPLVKLIGGLS